MKTVYILQSLLNRRRRYVGVTGDLKERLRAHNAGNVDATSSGRPWEVLVSIAFKDDDAAAGFEAYLKSGAGRAFAQKHFMS